jgi:hypothetical protein
MTPAQCRAARGLVGLPRPELAKASIVPNDMIADFEVGIRTPNELDLAAMQQALEAAGVEFIEDIGVKLRK